MRTIVTVLVALGLAILAGIVVLRTPPARLARQLKIVAGIALLALAIGLLIVRQVALALPVGIAGFMLVRSQAGVRSSPSDSGASSVRTAGLEMNLDHASGAMDGEILAGVHAARHLSELSLDELRRVAEDFRGDAESLRLLEAYLDRTHSGWREAFEAHEAGRQSAAPGSGRMSAQEAYELLGLQPGAGEAEVREAHRRLMKQVHPDRGGSAALAAKINQAKDALLGKHG